MNLHPPPWQINNCTLIVVKIYSLYSCVILIVFLNFLFVFLSLYWVLTWFKLWANWNFIITPVQLPLPTFQAKFCSDIKNLMWIWGNCDERCLMWFIHFEYFFQLFWAFPQNTIQWTLLNKCLCQKCNTLEKKRHLFEIWEESTWPSNYSIKVWLGLGPAQISCCKCKAWAFFLGSHNVDPSESPY